MKAKKTNYAVKEYVSYDQSNEKHFQLFADRIAYLSFEVADKESVNTWLDVELKCAQYHVIMENCQSPIERIMGAGLLFMTDGYIDIKYLEAIGQGEDKDWATFFTTQHEVAGYRLDFLIRLYMDGKHLDIAIECDGHDFHEKTKEQASRDKKRDRALAAANIIVLRFTGSDIYSRTESCLSEISDFLFEKRDALLVYGGHIRGKNNG